MTDSRLDSPSWLDTAASIARRLVATARWSTVDAFAPGTPKGTPKGTPTGTPCCTWQVSTDDGAGGVQPRDAGGAIYQGSAGIAFFLAQLHRITGDTDAARTAVGALEHALADGAAMSGNAWGFHVGRVGIAWVAVVAAPMLGRPDLAARGLELLRPLAGREHEDRGIDVIGGAAGAIPALLDLHRRLEGMQEAPPFDLADAARRLGEQLVASAHQEPDGWTWPTLPHAAVRNLAGFAHGTSGIALALLELAAAAPGTEAAGRFRFAAEMAFLAERGAFDPARSNWRDWRNMQLSDLYRQGAMDTLRALIRRDAVPEPGTTFLAAWCHGAPGIGLSRLRAWQLTGRTRERDELAAALTGTLPSLHADRVATGSFCLCHGVAGNAELLLEVLRAPDADSLVDDDTLEDTLHPRGKLREHLRNICEEAAARGQSTYEAASTETRSAWPSGMLGQAPDASLLLGDAGIGLFYLRLAHPDVPTPLLLAPTPARAASEDTQTAPAGDEARGFADAARRSVDGFFGATRRAWRRLDAPLDVPEPPFDRRLDVSPVRTAERAIEARLESSPDAATAEHELVERLDDASLVERTACAATRAIDDFTAENLRALVREPWEALDHQALRAGALRFVLPPEAQLVWTEHDWPTWLETDETDETGTDAAPPAASPTPWLLVRRDQRLHPQRVPPFAAVLLDTIADATDTTEVTDVTEPAGVSVAALVDAVAEALGESASSSDQRSSEQRPDIDQVVVAQLAQLYRVGYLDVTSDAEPAANG